MTICEMTVMDQSGDTKIVWDPNVPEEVEQARRTFNELTKRASEGGKGYQAFSVNPEDATKGEMIREFDPNAAKVILSPPMVGG